MALCNRFAKRYSASFYIRITDSVISLRQWGTARVSTSGSRTLLYRFANGGLREFLHPGHGTLLYRFAKRDSASFYIRVTESRRDHFAKSEQLAVFLLFVCEIVLIHLVTKIIAIRITVMTSSPPRSPDGQNSKGKKEETFLEKIGGTLVRKKRSKEVNDLQSDGRNALNNPLSSASFDMQLDENEEKVILHPIAKSDPKLQQLQHVLIDWINDVLVDERIIVKCLEDDLYDGQVLQKLLEKLGNHKLNVAEVTQSTVSQRQKLQTVLNSVDQLLKYRQEKIKWNVDLIHSKCLWGILHLLVALVNHFDAPIQLPQDVSVALLVLKKTPAGMTSEPKQEIIVGSNLYVFFFFLSDKAF
uniref:Parvin, beta n=1 Tax=Eptatretus burgeri TaxID=7764 RepID=A0A8C4N8H2_EPTBU